MKKLLSFLCILAGFYAVQAQQTNEVMVHSTHYLLYIPDEVPESGAYPLLLFLHGAGERGDDLEMVKKHGPPSLVDAQKDFPFVLVSPQCPRNSWWDSRELLRLLDQVESKVPIDPDRVYVTGLSMGGFGTWALAMEAPRRFAAIMPICGGGDLERVERIKHIPVWVFHGAKDPVVPVQRSDDMVNALKELGADVKYTRYPEANHDSWTETYANPEVYEWILSHKRK